MNFKLDFGLLILNLSLDYFGLDED